MSGILRSWIMGAMGAAILCAVCSELTPPGRVKAVQKTICGIVMTLAVISPIFTLDLSGYAMDLARYRTMAMEDVKRGDEQYQSLSRTYIQEELRAYILDKARDLGASVSDARVTLAWDREGGWYPENVELWGDYSRDVAAVIEADLGLNSEEQHWSGE